MYDVTRTSIGYGDPGIMQTLDLMRMLVSRGVDTPPLVQLARRLAVGAGIRQPFAQASAIRAWLQGVWRFVDDPVDRELLRDPANMVNEYDSLGGILGDCDEAAVMGAALGRAIGLRATFTVLYFKNPGGPDYLHVYASLLTDTGQAVSLDVTKPTGPVPSAYRYLTVDA